jgi:hypothetical protein
MVFVSAAAIARSADGTKEYRAIILGAALVTAAVTVVSPAHGVLALVALAPFNHAIRVVGWQVDSNDILLLLVGLSVLPRLRLRDTPYWARLGTLLLVSGSVLAAVSAVDPQTALWGAARWAAAGSVLLYSISAARRSDAWIRRVTLMISASAIVVAAFAIAQRAGVTWFVGSPYLTDRIDSTFGYFTQFGGFMSMAAVVSGWRLLFARTGTRAIEQLVIAAAFASSLIAVGISLSRGALLFLVAAGGAAMIIGSRRPAVLLRAAVGTAAVVALATQILPPVLVSRFAERVFTHQGGDVLRAQMQTVGATLLGAHPAGLGYGNFGLFLSQHAAADVTKALFHAHRTPVQMGLDAGWVGLAGFTLLILGALATAGRAWGRRTGLAWGGFTVALVGFCAQGWFDYLFYETSWVVFFVVLVAGVGCVSRPHKLARRSGRSRGAYR